jgi:hypothetical protein
MFVMPKAALPLVAFSCKTLKNFCVRLEMMLMDGEFVA